MDEAKVDHRNTGQGAWGQEAACPGQGRGEAGGRYWGTPWGLSGMAQALQLS